jgi:prepilin-type N-terminal cleavage/methylation domain-containing protein
VKKSIDGARGFTLLEVLAAVAILGIWFAVLANVAIQGLRAEGVTERRIRASLIADRVLTGIELGLDAGELPGDDVEELEEDEFVVAVEQLPLTGIEAAGVDEALMELFEGELAALAADLYTLEVRVRWTEGSGEEEVVRTTYVWDSGPLLEALGSTVPEDGEEEDAEGDAEYDEDLAIDDAGAVQ